MRRVLVGVLVVLFAVGAWLYIDSDADAPEDPRSFLPDQATARSTLDGLAEIDPAFADTVNFQVLGSVLCRGLENDRDAGELRQIVLTEDTRKNPLSATDADRVVGVYRERYCPNVKLPR